MTVILRPETPHDLKETTALFREYADWLKDDICLYDFEEEMKVFPRPYVAPEGALFLARNGTAGAGAVGVRPFGGGVCEMKRLYVRPDHRSARIGRALAEATLDWARAAGYDAMRLDTLKTLTAARGLYESLGFREIPPYNPNPPERVLFFEKRL